eukprot:GFUD01075444.1.p1 GENE.GFUD01075444.1~~GFUD01075444.1.p1  ORF type:complete len:224 (-),score=61.05 GFUD01075444.1:86-757(-)
MFGPVQICLVLLSISFVQVTCKPQQDFGSMLGGILKDPNIQGVLNNLDGQDLSGLLNNFNLDDLADNPDLGGIIGGLLNIANTPRTSENEETGNAGADQSLGGINLFEILKNIDLGNLNLDNIDLGPHKNFIQSAVNIIKNTSPEDLGELSKAIEENPDALQGILGLDSNVDPEIVKAVAGMINSEVNRMKTTSPPEEITSGCNHIALSIFFSFCLLFKIIVI